MVSKDAIKERSKKAHTTPEYSSTHTSTHSMNDKMIVMKALVG
jgi:hypothetical protein